MLLALTTWGAINNYYYLQQQSGDGDVTSYITENRVSTAYLFRIAQFVEPLTSDHLQNQTEVAVKESAFYAELTKY